MSVKRIIFEDKFNYTGFPDRLKYNYDIGGHGWGNSELQYYSSSIGNAYVENGKLIIEAKRENKISMGDNGLVYQNDFSSAKITTYQRQSFKYGSFRICCKIPTEKGVWPAIWLLPNSYKKGNKWPKCGEIDILEYVSNHPKTLFFSLHSNDYNFKKKNQLTRVVTTETIGKFAEYRMDWTKEYFEYFIDNKSVAKIERLVNANENNWPFDEEYYLIINLAVGGSWPGLPDDDFVNSKFEIKYIKVYEI